MGLEGSRTLVWCDVPLSIKLTLAQDHRSIRQRLFVTNRIAEVVVLLRAAVVGFH